VTSVAEETPIRLSRIKVDRWNKAKNLNTKVLKNLLFVTAGIDLSFLSLQTPLIHEGKIFS